MFNFLQALLAIVLGNVLYFLLLPSLPPRPGITRFTSIWGRWWTSGSAWWCTG
jgi:hypothetical protein